MEGGGGGSGYAHPDKTSDATLTPGSGNAPGNDVFGSKVHGGSGCSANGQDGFVRITIDGEDHDFDTGEAHVFTVP
jgi:hypothetical protein